jgi:aspartyl-tRNA(Asn)/glutamyl-tRNA(Gln) amidotransferase subunit B
MSYEVVIGLEVHVQLQTQSKIFSSAATAYGAEPNTQASLVDLGLPGVLPVLNKKVVEYAIRFGLSVDAEINPTNVFARKNYFYPDLPKGYQISQFDQPIVSGGHLDIDVPSAETQKRIHLTRAHLEEDAGKSLHMNQHHASGIDLNRAGTPLLEIVSEPEMRSGEEAVAYLKQLHRLVKYIGICDGNMQEGSFRCDINISLRPFGQSEFGTRAEIKNVNSFRFVEQAITYEIERQSDCLDRGEKVIQETRLYNPDTQTTHSMRSKEDAHDYRYFPDPDLLPVQITEKQIAEIKSALPELPKKREQRFIQELKLTPQDAKQITQERETADFFEQILLTDPKVEAKHAANLVNSDIAALLKKHQTNINAIPVNNQQCAQVILRTQDSTLSSTMAKQLLNTLWEQGGNVDEIIERDGLKQMNDDSALRDIVQSLINNNPKQAQELRQGKEKLIGFFVGQAMKQTQGKANPQQLNKIIKEILEL